MTEYLFESSLPGLKTVVGGQSKACQVMETVLVVLTSSASVPGVLDLIPKISHTTALRKIIVPLYRITTKEKRKHAYILK